jgi:hypothetical protein
MNVLRMLFSLMLVIAINATATQPVCAYSSPAERMTCCCEQETFDECSITQGSCCSADQQQDTAVPNSVTTTVSPVSSGAEHVWLAINDGANACDAAVAEIHALSKPLHLASNKLYLRKRSLLI